MREIGLHLRLRHSLLDLMQQAHQMGLRFFQCFLMSQDTNKLVELRSEERDQILAFRRAHFGPIIIHGSYWINLSSTTTTRHWALERELALASRLECDAIVLHPGYAKGATQKEEGIDALARALNHTARFGYPVKIILENVAHGGLSVGGDLHDFKLLLEKVDQPENLSFCIDTAHAYCYGYALETPQDLQAFIDTLENTVTLAKIALIHLNDTTQLFGSMRDQHAMPGTGFMGIQTLKQFSLSPALAQVPMILELPVLDEPQERAALELVRSWHT